MRPFRWLLPLVTLSLALPATARVTRERTGPALTATTARDWLRHPHDERFYTESWTAIVRAESGLVLYVHYMLTNIGVVSGRAAVEVSLTPPGGQGHARKAEHDLDTYAEDAGAGRIQIGGSTWTLEGRRSHMIIREKDVQADLRFEGWVDGVKLYTGRLWLDEEGPDHEKTEFADVFFHVPRADVSGTITVAGTTYPIKGAGYIDHWVQNKLAGDWSTRWSNARAFGPDHTLFYMTADVTKERGGGRVSWAILTDRQRVVALTDNVQAKPGGRTKDPQGHAYDTRAEVRVQGAMADATFTVTSARLHERVAVVEEMPWAQRQVAKMVAGNPIIYRMDATFDATFTPRGGEPLTLSGPALMESIVM